MTKLDEHQEGIYIANSPFLFASEFATQQWLLGGRKVTLGFKVLKLSPSWCRKRAWRFQKANPSFDDQEFRWMAGVLIFTSITEISSRYLLVMRPRRHEG